MEYQLKRGEEKCPICKEPMNNMARLNCCSHTYCFDCISNWCQINAKCPLCQLPISDLLTKVETIYLWERHKVGSLKKKSGCVTGFNSLGSVSETFKIRFQLYHGNFMHALGLTENETQEEMIEDQIRINTNNEIQYKKLVDDRQPTTDLKINKKSKFQSLLKFRNLLRQFTKRELTIALLSNGCELELSQSECVFEQVWYILFEQSEKPKYPSLKNELQSIIFELTHVFLFSIASFCKLKYEISTYDQLVHAQYSELQQKMREKKLEREMEIEKEKIKIKRKKKIRLKKQKKRKKKEMEKRKRKSSKKKK
ncbi:topoisomerase i-binding arginine/serine-rich a-related [Anaeramoeba flamelloides]|uniref:Topoisomerase i-binding arginine/serine-rich a-related n=1 Tax=Anaeramoeba flamelloides TaxID=1746091 RepID=A0AAV7Y487_9EUKA|nr:topoisomerase i-binding arginine/serine-rich a-related [Anaeramoeba flamelloides]